MYCEDAVGVGDNFMVLVMLVLVLAEQFAFRFQRFSMSPPSGALILLQDHGCVTQLGSWKLRYPHSFTSGCSGTPNTCWMAHLSQVPKGGVGKSGPMDLGGVGKNPVADVVVGFPSMAPVQQPRLQQRHPGLFQRRLWCRGCRHHHRLWECVLLDRIRYTHPHVGCPVLPSCGQTCTLSPSSLSFMKHDSISDANWNRPSRATSPVSSRHGAGQRRPPAWPRAGFDTSDVIEAGRVPQEPPGW